MFTLSGTDQLVDNLQGYRIGSKEMQNVNIIPNFNCVREAPVHCPLLGLGRVVLPIGLYNRNGVV